MLDIRFHHVTCPTPCKDLVVLPCQFLLTSIMQEKKIQLWAQDFFFFQSEIELGPSESLLRSLQQSSQEA